MSGRNILIERVSNRAVEKKWIGERVEGTFSGPRKGQPRLHLRETVLN